MDVNIFQELLFTKPGRASSSVLRSFVADDVFNAGKEL